MTSEGESLCEIGRPIESLQEKSGASKQPGAILWRKRGKWRAGSLGRASKNSGQEQEQISGRGAVRPYAQQGAKKTGEVWRGDFYKPSKEYLG